MNKSKVPLYKIPSFILQQYQSSIVSVRELLPCHLASTLLLIFAVQTMRLRQRSFIRSYASYPSNKRTLQTFASRNTSLEAFSVTCLMNSLFVSDRQDTVHSTHLAVSLLLIRRHHVRYILNSRTHITKYSTDLKQQSPSGRQYITISAVALQ